MKTQPTENALLISDREAAALAGISRATWWRLHAAAKTPAAVKLGRRCLWIKAEVVGWIDARCPDRRTLEATRAMGRRLKVSG